ncbi:MAG: response regulator transcription factor [Nitrospirota bacterium]
MKRILVVEDEPDIASLVSYNLKKEGFAVTTVHEGGEALDAVKKKEFDLILLDLMLPGIHGMEVCRILRAGPKTKNIPIIMLTAKGDEADRVRGLETGADDYMTKPFSPRELIARVKAVLRRSGDNRKQDEVVRIGSLMINKDTFSVSKNNKRIELSATEFRLLLHLAERKGRIFSREQLLGSVWKDETFVEPRTVDVHIRRLRSQIEDDPSEPDIIKTKRGIGYYCEENR